MKKALYIGIFSGTNIGDLAISNEISGYLMSSGKYNLDLMDFRTIRKIDKPSTTITKHFAAHNKLPIKEKLKQIYLSSVFYEWHNQIILKTYYIIKECTMSHLDGFYFKSYKDIIEEYETIFIGGGNLLMSISSNQWAIKIDKLIEIAKDKNKTVS